MTIQERLTRSNLIMLKIKPKTHSRSGQSINRSGCTF